MPQRTAPIVQAAVEPLKVVRVHRGRFLVVQNIRNVLFSLGEGEQHSVLCQSWATNRLVNFNEDLNSIVGQTYAELRKSYVLDCKAFEIVYAGKVSMSTGPVDEAMCDD